MSRYAIIENGTVINLINATQDFIDQSGLNAVLVDNIFCDIGWEYNGQTFNPPTPTQVPVSSIINNRLAYFQQEAPKLLRELYTENTLAGISTSQSDQMFDDYQDVLTRIREGAFPTAVYRLQQKQPIGFVTQALIDAWIAKIQAYL